MHCARGIVKLLIVLFLLKCLGKLVRLEELAELLPGLKLCKDLLSPLFCLILSL